jgi:transposase-like protein
MAVFRCQKDCHQGARVIYRRGHSIRVIAALLRKAAATSYPHGAAACREKAEALRAKYGL